MVEGLYCPAAASPTTMTTSAIQPRSGILMRAARQVLSDGNSPPLNPPSPPWPSHRLRERRLTDHH